VVRRYRQIDKQRAYAARGSEEVAKGEVGLAFLHGRTCKPRGGWGQQGKPGERDADRDDPRIRAIGLGGDSNAPRVCRAQRE
jgi:hypothetical protein